MAKRLYNAISLAGDRFDCTRLSYARGAIEPVSSCSGDFAPAAETAGGDGSAADADAPAPAEPAAIPSALSDFVAKSGGKLTLCVGSGISIFKSLTLPTTEPSELLGMVALQLDKIMPLPDGEMSFSYEVVSAGETSTTVLACAVANSQLEAAAGKLGLKRSDIVRIDSAPLAFARSIANAGLTAGAGRELALIDQGTSATLCLLDENRPAMAHAIASLAPQCESDLIRAIRLTLAQAEMDLGERVLERVTIVSDSPDAAAAAGIAKEVTGIDAIVVGTGAVGPISAGAAMRTAEGSTFNLTPASWTASISDRKFRTTMAQVFFGGLAVWAVAALFVFGGAPIMRQRIKHMELSKDAIKPAANAVSDVRNRVRMIQAYMDRSRAPLEALREVCLPKVMPDGITMTSFMYNRKDRRVVVEGTARNTSLVYVYKQRIDASAMFAESALTRGPTTNPKTGDAAFTLSILMKEDQE